MSGKSKAKSAETKEDRLKAALKANLQRRKAQARARSAKQVGDEAPSEKE